MSQGYTYSRPLDNIWLANPSNRIQKMGVLLLGINFNYIRSYFWEVLIKMPHLFESMLGFSLPTTEKFLTCSNLILSCRKYYSKQFKSPCRTLDGIQNPPAFHIMLDCTTIHVTVTICGCTRDNLMSHYHS